jgi:O-antigen ligase
LYYSGVIQTVTFYFAILYLLRKLPGFADKIIFALALSTFLAGLVAVVELRNIGLELVNIFLMRNKFGFGYHNANLFGIHAALLFPISIYLIKSADFDRTRIILWISFLILSALAVLTLNRGTFVVIAFNLLVLFWKKETRKIVVGFFIIGVIAAFYFSDMIFLYLSRFFSDTGGQVKFLRDESALFRIEVWRVGIETIFQYPLGVGGTGFHLMWQKISIAPDLYFGTPHQIFLYLGVDYGVPAMLVFIFFVVAVIRKTSSLYALKNLRNNELFYYIRLSIIGYLIHGFLTGGELSHLWGNISPNNGFSYILMILIAIVSYHLSFVGSEPYSKSVSIEEREK